MVDYVGIGHHLKKAIDIYDEREQKEIIDALSFPDEELRELEEAHAAVMALLQQHELTDMSDHDAFYDVFYDEDLRFDFMLAFKRLTKALNLLFPTRQALEFMGDYKALAEINVLAGKHFRDQRLSMKGIPAKLRAITDAHLESRGLDVKVQPISILDEDFEKGVGEYRRTKTKAAEIEHAIRLKSALRGLRALSVWNPSYWTPISLAVNLNLPEEWGQALHCHIRPSAGSQACLYHAVDGAIVRDDVVACGARKIPARWHRAPRSARRARVIRLHRRDNIAWRSNVAMQDLTPFRHGREFGGARSFCWATAFSRRNGCRYPSADRY